jgi:serine protease Do
MTIDVIEAALDLVSPAVSELSERAQSGVVQVTGRGRGGGAGIVWSADGRVLTNAHVVAGARGVLSVTLTDGRAFEARVLAEDRRLDLALLQLDARDLPAVPAGDSTQLRVGELVFAIGHPWGQRHVLTAGIISALDTTPDGDGERVPYIRTDTRLRPGNSGGPLLNARGEVVGINAMVFGGDLSIAIPSHVAGAWVARQSGGRAALGAQVQAAALGNGTGQASGLLVAGLVAGGAAERAGLLVGDVLLAAEGLALESPKALAELLAQRAPGQTLSLDVLRGGVSQRLTVALG